MEVTFKIAKATTTTVSIPSGVPDIAALATTTALILLVPTTTWKQDADDDGVGKASPVVLGYDATHIRADWQNKATVIATLRYRAVGELVRS